MAQWMDNRGRFVRSHTDAKAELALNHAPDAVIISSNPRLAVPNFDRCRRDRFCRCAKCKPSLAVA